MSFGNYRTPTSVSRQFEEKTKWKLSIQQTYGAAAGVEEEAGVVEAEVTIIEEDAGVVEADVIIIEEDAGVVEANVVDEDVVAVEEDISADDDVLVEAVVVLVAVAVAVVVVAVSVAVTVDGSTAPVGATMTVKPPATTQLFPGTQQASPPSSVV